MLSQLLRQEKIQSQLLTQPDSQYHIHRVKVHALLGETNTLTLDWKYHHHFLPPFFEIWLLSFLFDNREVQMQQILVQKVCQIKTRSTTFCSVSLVTTTTLFTLCCQSTCKFHHQKQITVADRGDESVSPYCNLPSC